MSIVQGGEGHQGELPIRREPQAAGLAQQWKQGLEREPVERLRVRLEGGVLDGQGVPQPRGGEVDGLGGTQIPDAKGGVGKQQQREVAGAEPAVLALFMSGRSS